MPKSVQDKTNLLAVSAGLFIPRTTGVERTGEGELEGCARGGMGVRVCMRVCTCVCTRVYACVHTCTNGHASKVESKNFCSHMN